MTESAAEVDRVRQAMAAGMSAAQQSDNWALTMQATISGSEVAIDPAVERPDAIAVGWFGTPGQQPAVFGDVPAGSPNISTPYDVTLSSPGQPQAHP